MGHRGPGVNERAHGKDNQYAVFEGSDLPVLPGDESNRGDVEDQDSKATTKVGIAKSQSSVNGIERPSSSSVPTQRRNRFFSLKRLFRMVFVRTTGSRTGSLRPPRLSRVVNQWRSVEQVVPANHGQDVSDSATAVASNAFPDDATTIPMSDADLSPHRSRRLIQVEEYVTLTEHYVEDTSTQIGHDEDDIIVHTSTSERGSSPRTSALHDTATMPNSTDLSSSREARTRTGAAPTDAQDAFVVSAFNIGMDELLRVIIEVLDDGILREECITILLDPPTRKRIEHPASAYDPIARASTFLNYVLNHPSPGIRHRLTLYFSSHAYLSPFVKPEAVKIAREAEPDISFTNKGDKWIEETFIDGVTFDDLATSLQSYLAGELLWFAAVKDSLSPLTRAYLKDDNILYTKRIRCLLRIMEISPLQSLRNGIVQFCKSKLDLAYLLKGHTSGLR